MSILVDFYNLDLDTSGIANRKNWSTPEKDRPKIIEFLEKHAPEVFKLKTPEEIKKEVDFDTFEVLGTLGWYEETQEKSWFLSDDAKQFYIDHLRIRELVLSYLTLKKIKKRLLPWVVSIGKSITPSIVIIDMKSKELFPPTLFSPKEIDLSKHKILRAHSSGGRWSLATYEAAFALYDEIISLLEGKLELKRCGTDDCNKIFRPAPQGSEQKYCSVRCRNRIAQRKARKKRK